jgi:hypothetical protein
MNGSIGAMAEKLNAVDNKQSRKSIAARARRGHLKWVARWHNNTLFDKVFVWQATNTFSNMPRKACVFSFGHLSTLHLALVAR